MTSGDVGTRGAFADALAGPDGTADPPVRTAVTPVYSDPTSESAVDRDSPVPRSGPAPPDAADRVPGPAPVSGPTPVSEEARRRAEAQLSAERRRPPTPAGHRRPRRPNRPGAPAGPAAQRAGRREPPGGPAVASGQPASGGSGEPSARELIQRFAGTSGAERRDLMRQVVAQARSARRSGRLADSLGDLFGGR